MSFTLTTSGACFAKAGANADDTLEGEDTIYTKWSDDVESTINLKTRFDWVANYANVTANFQGVLSDLASDLIAIKIISYNMSGYLKYEAQTLLDVLKSNSDLIMKDLREKNYQEVTD